MNSVMTVAAPLHHSHARGGSSALDKADNFTVIRLLLAVLVVYSHSYGLLKLPEPTIFGRSFGNFAVHCFFALSGYFITQSAMRLPTLWAFAVHRALRILPALLVALGFSLLMAKLCGQFAQNPIAYLYNGAAWTLSWEALCYALSGALAALGLLTRQSYNPLFLVLALAGAIALMQPTLPTQVLMPMLLMFAVGGLIAVNEREINLKRSIWLILPVVLIVLLDRKMRLLSALDFIPFAYAPQGLTVGYWRMIIYLFTVPFVVIFLGRHLRFRLPLKHDLSYGTYLYAWPVSQSIIYLHQQMGWTMKPLPLFFETLMLTLPLAYISWRLVEKPTLRLKSLVH